MSKLNELLKQKFASGNDVPVSSVRITREEYESAVKDAIGVELTDAEAKLPYKWTGCHEADTALILIGRIDAPDDQVRLDQLEQLCLSMGNTIVAKRVK